MSPQLASLLIALGLSVGNSTLYMVRDNADPIAVRNHALDAGFVARAAEVEFQVLDQPWLADAGVAASRYVRVQFPIGLSAGGAPDGGNLVILPDLPLRRLQATGGSLRDVDVSTCAARPNVCTLWGNARPFKLAPHLCAWKPTAGAACSQSDGGVASVRTTMQPGMFAGAGCQLKTCTIIAGDTE